MDKDAWVLCTKKRKIGNGNLYLTKNQFGGNETCCVEDNYSYISNMCAKQILRFKY